MKKTLNQILALMMALVLAACTGGNSENNTGYLPRAKSVTTLTSNNFLDYLSSVLNRDWRTVASIRTSFNNTKGSLPGDAASPLSSGSSRLFMNLSYQMCSTAAGTEFAAAASLRQTFRFINSGVSPVIGPTTQNEGAVAAFLTNLAARFWNRPPMPEELAELKALWINLAGVAGSSTQDVAIRCCAVVAVTTQALTAIQ